MRKPRQSEPRQCKPQQRKADDLSRCLMPLIADQTLIVVVELSLSGGEARPDDEAIRCRLARCHAQGERIGLELSARRRTAKQGQAGNDETGTNGCLEQLPAIDLWEEA
jgi:hypothetical protein